MREIDIQVDTEVIRGKKITDWNCFHITIDGIKKTILVDYKTSSTLTSEGYEISWGTVYGHQEDPTFKDEVDIDYDSVERDLGDGELVSHTLTEEEEKQLNEYILCEYDFEDERQEAYDNHINRD
jgi:hypothetical protein